MNMTHYMGLLAENQPWNLILFMVIPVGLAEALVSTEFFVVHFGERKDSAWHTWNHWLGIAAGSYFACVFLYLITQVVPQIEWRGWIDVLAVGAYLAGIVPLLGITLLELGAWGKGLSEKKRVYAHFILLIGFLVVSHVAMIFGMVDPTLGGWQPPAHHETHGHSHADEAHSHSM